jgi:hypothetical protein
MMRMRWRRFVAERDEDLGPRIVSWTISLAAGAAWLAVVYLSPPRTTVIVKMDSASTPVIDFEPGQRVSSTGGTSERPRSVVRPRIAGSDVAEAFASSIVRKVGPDVAALIDRVEAVGAITTTILAGDKATLATGAEHATPGAAKFGDRADAGGVGTVAHGGAVPRAEVRMAPLAVVAPSLPNAAVIDATEAAAFVRARAAQLQYCYARTAGAAESDLAGVVTLRLVLGPNGAVREADVVRRTWSGPAAAETEACVLAAARDWRLPSATNGGTLTLPISFTRSR